MRDYMTPFVQDMPSMTRLKYLYDKYGKLSGLHINKEKT